jgi:hypothetical protein
MGHRYFFVFFYLDNGQDSYQHEGNFRDSAAVGELQQAGAETPASDPDLGEARDEPAGAGVAAALPDCADPAHRLARAAAANTFRLARISHNPVDHQWNAYLGCRGAYVLVRSASGDREQGAERSGLAEQVSEAASPGAA